MNKSFRYVLENRLQCMLAWQHVCLEYFKHQQISEKTNIKYYEERKVEGLFFKLYFLPLNIFTFFVKAKQKRDYLKGVIEIEVLKEELYRLDNIKRIGELDG